MTIQPPANRPREISVTEAIEPAIERVKLMLFRPFIFSKWIIIGFCAWLAGLGESGGGGGFNGFNNFNNHGNRPQPAEQFRQFYNHAHEFVLANLDWIVPVAVFGTILIVAIGLAVLWLNSRGKFMFLHCVALDKAEVDIPWRTYAAQGNSLFWFRLVVCFAGLALCLPLLIFLAATIIQMVLQGGPNVAAVMLAVGLGLGLILVGIPFALVRKLTADFVVPIMYLRGRTCTTAWGELWTLLSANPGSFVVYLLFQIVLTIVIGVIVMAAVLVTCCIALCFLALPFVGTVLLLPILIFKRSYSLLYLAQFGPEYDVFPQPAAPPAPPEAPISPLGPIPT
jgi:hypothetical protein